MFPLPKLAFRLLAVLAALVLTNGLAHARTIANTAELNGSKDMMAYVLSQPMLEIMVQLGRAADQKFDLQSDCKQQYHLKPTGAAVFAPIEFPEGKTNPVKGIWAVRFQLERCGDLKTYNALFLAKETGDFPTSKSFYPGSTRAGPELVYDAMRIVQRGAIAAAGQKECKDVAVFDMRVSEPPHDVTEGAKTSRNVWSEVWTFRMCGKTVDAEVKFIPDPDGPGATFAPGPVTVQPGPTPAPAS